FPKDSFNEVKNLFLDLYKVFRKFQQDKIKNRDGSLNDKGGFEFQTIEDETILLYSKINMFDTILDEFDEMDIYSFHIKRSNTEHIDYSKIDKYIDRAIFLENNIIYLDEVEVNRDILHFYEAELVEMFCYIYLDIKKVLQEEESISQHIVTLALNFREKYLTYESSLFEENSFEITKDTLKERLEIIDKKSLLKDEVYDKFYVAIYTFLYGNPFFEGDSDIYWGINNFSFIWEEMAHYYFFDKYKDKILEIENDYIQNIDEAEALAKRRIIELRNPLDFIEIEVIGNPEIKVGDVVRIQDSYDGTNKNLFVVSSRISFTDEIVQTLRLESKILNY
ncbi:MAG: hypothetical protein KAU90_07520, partial [Sulfurovaceae bacterium]|nr:hypothetical protein [Sulfurovaceae bacterium]